MLKASSFFSTIAFLALCCPSSTFGQFFENPFYDKPDNVLAVVSYGGTNPNQDRFACANDALGNCIAEGSRSASISDFYMGPEQTVFCRASIESGKTGSRNFAHPNAKL